MDTETHLVRMPEVRRRLGFAQSRAVLAAAARFQIPVCRLTRNSKTANVAHQNRRSKKWVTRRAFIV
jgi:hypothetical protein